MTHRGSGHRLAQWEGCSSWSTIRGRLGNAIFNWEVGAPPRSRSRVCAARDDTRFMAFLPSSVQALNNYSRYAQRTECKIRFSLRMLSRVFHEAATMISFWPDALARRDAGRIH